MKDEVKFEKPTEESLKKLGLLLRLYAFDCTPEQVRDAVRNDKETLTLHQRRRNPMLVEIVKVFQNRRGTMKVVCTNNGYFCIMGRSNNMTSCDLMTTNWRDGLTYIYDNSNEGAWLVMGERWSNELVPYFPSDAKSLGEAKEWLRLYNECWDIKEKNGVSEEIRDVGSIDLTNSIATTQVLQKKKEELDLALQRYIRLEAQEAVLKQTAIDSIKVSTRDLVTTVDLVALDKKPYHLEVEGISRKLDKEDLMSLVYRHRYGLRYLTESLSTDLFKWFFTYLGENFRDTKIRLSINARPPVELEFKSIKAGYIDSAGSPVATYLSGSRVAWNSLEVALHDYFLTGSGLPNVTLSVDVKIEQASKATKISKMERTLNEGLNGTVSDLEGDYPIKMAFEKEGSKWFLVIGELRLHLQGGQGTIESLKAVLSGKALHYEARNSTEELYTRLCKVLPEEQALEVIQTSKEMGRLISKLDRKGEKT